MDLSKAFPHGIFMEDTSFEDLLVREKSSTAHKTDTYKLIVKIYKSVHYVSPPNIQNILDLKSNHYKLGSNYLLKWTAANTHFLSPV